MVISQRLGDMNRIAECLEGFASLAPETSSMEAGRGDGGASGSPETREGRERAQRAARLFGAAAALRERVGASIIPQRRAHYEREVAATRAMVDAATFAAAWEEGR